jgi:hypothetical protein
MSTYNEPIRPLEFLDSEAPGSLSRENVTLTASQGALVAGTVLAKVTSTGHYVVYDNASVTAGINVADAVLAYPAENSGSTQSVTVIERLAEVKSASLNWGSNDGAGITAGTADLLAKNIKIRA